MLLEEQKQTDGNNVSGKSTGEFIIMSYGLVAVISCNGLPTKISRRRSLSSRLWVQLLRQLGLIGNATAHTRATPAGNGASSSTRSTSFSDRATTRRDFDPSH